jgi:rod shape-determining protein MreC
MKRLDSSRRIMIAVAIGALLVLAGVSGALGPVVWTYDHSVLPVGRSLSSVGSGVGNFFGLLGQVRNLSDENAKLELQNATLRGRLAASADALRENDQLRRQLGLQEAGTPQQVGADVVAFQPDSYRQFLTIDRGTRNGIKVGQAALNNGIVVGTISAVSSTTAKLQLITDPEFALAVRDQETGALGVLYGQLGGGLTVNNIAQTDNINPGDTIASSGLGGIVPENLLIGQVQSVNAQTNGIFKSAQVSTTLQAEQLRFVFVVVGS